ncbi:hypothetical protein [Streptomyces abikoensis]|uniref:hypothetical protein n=1 Tax=Streptomyces abikoensis TaxID=97398 RepID=UPI001679ECD3|nr:hypothetical protein [Streptomyces abikoensis]GGP40776.1 hypothetical protein GCM10010214_12710 [Streptomyces abikoensis]
MSDDEVLALFGARIEQSLGRTLTDLQQHIATTAHPDAGLAGIVEAYARLSELQQTLEGHHDVLLERLGAAEDGLSEVDGGHLLEAAGAVTEAMAARDAQATALLRLVDRQASRPLADPVAAQARRAAATAHSPNYPLATAPVPAVSTVPPTAIHTEASARRR